MLTIFNRYVLRELLTLFSIALVALTMVMIVLGVVQEAIRMNLGLGPMLKLIPFVVPNALVFAVPGTILFAVCMLYGRMSADNEIVALKALGIGPRVVMMPAFVIGFLLSLLTVWLIDVAYSWAYLEAQRVIVQSVEEIAYGMLRTQRNYSNQRFSIIVKGVEGHQLLYPIMTFQPDGELPGFTLTADSAELHSNLERNTLRLILTNSELETSNGVQASFPGIVEREIPLSFASTRGDVVVGPAQVALRNIPTEIESQTRLIRELEQSTAADTGFLLATGDLALLHNHHWMGHEFELNHHRRRLIRLRVEPWRRWSAGFSCLCFVFVGVPLAIYRKNSDYMTTFFYCFFPTLLFYYPLMITALDRAKAGHWPPYTLWLPNVAMLIAGWYLIRKVERY
jgi:lipopolysaccharide export system permease protein